MEKQVMKINGVSIVTVERDGEVFVAVKPICEALGVDFAAQYNKIKSDEDLSSTIAIIAIVASDGKEREMVCMPLMYVYGWLFTINPGKVSPEAREVVRKYRLECYRVLYRHFTTPLMKASEFNDAERKLLDLIARDIEEEKEVKARRKRNEESLMKLRHARLDDQPTLFD